VKSRCPTGQGFWYKVGTESGGGVAGGIDGGAVKKFLILIAVLAAGYGGFVFWQHQRTEKQQAAARLAAAHAMWYRFRLTAEYDGKPFSFDQFVHCGFITYGGGPFGAVSSLTTRDQHPGSIIQAMSDGSYVAVRIPDFCLLYRRYEPKKEETVSSRLPGWRLRGPYDVLPLVSWHRYGSAPRSERYISEAYYQHPRARLKNLKSTVEFMPLGYKPVNAEAIYQQKVDPGNLFPGGHFIMPIPDPRIFIPELVPTRMYGQGRFVVYDRPSAEARARATQSWTEAQFEEANRLRIERAWLPDNVFDGRWDYKSGCWSSMTGYKPLASNLPPDPYEYGPMYDPYPTTESVPAKRKLLDDSIAQRKACLALYGKAQTMMIVNGTFEPSRNSLGMLVYQAWPGGKEYKYRIDGVMADQFLYRNYVFDSKNNSWFVIRFLGGA
jgi:hypothetical protein